MARSAGSFPGSLGNELMEMKGRPAGSVVSGLSRGTATATTPPAEPQFISIYVFSFCFIFQRINTRNLENDQSFKWCDCH